MFGLNLFKTEKGKEKVDIYYSEMTPEVNGIIALVKKEKPVIYGILDEERTLLDPEEIYYFDTVDRRTFAYTDGNVCQVSKTLVSLEEELRSFGFVRINKANLVNIYMIKKIKPEPNMKVIAILKNGEKLQINRGYKRTFEDYLKEVRKSV